MILDVVYNHIGPSGNYLGQFSDDYLTEKSKTDWGTAINFGEENSLRCAIITSRTGPYWIREFHLDGLRLDATQAIFDSLWRDSREDSARSANPADHVLKELQEAARTAANGKSMIIVAENEDQDAALMARAWGRWSMERRLSPLRGRSSNREPPSLLSRPPGTSAGVHLRGEIRISVSGAAVPVAAKEARRGGARDLSEAVCDVCREPRSGRELGARTAAGRDHESRQAESGHSASNARTGNSDVVSGAGVGIVASVLVFCRTRAGVAKLVRTGRHDFLSQFPALGTPQMRRCLDDPESPKTFERCKLDWEEAGRERNRQWLELHRDLLRLRREDSAIRHAAVRQSGRRGTDGPRICVAIFSARRTRPAR